MEILVDSLIGLLERSSAFLRNVAGQVFAVFSADMTEESIDHLIDVRSPATDCFSYASV